MPMTLLKKSNAGSRKGMVLILSLFAVTFLISLTASVSFRSVQQLSHAKRFVDGTKAFWIAETGLNRFRHDQTMLDGGPVTIQIGSGQVVVSKKDGDDRVVTAAGTYGNISKTLELKFSGSVSSVLDNTISSGGADQFSILSGLSFHCSLRRADGQCLRNDKNVVVNYQSRNRMAGKFRRASAKFRDHHSVS